MNPQLYQLLCGAGIEDVVIPRKKFISEHNHLIKLLRSSDNPALQKEANSQSDELHSLKGGFTKKSGFIRRLMAENALKHKGQYQNPTYPLHPESTMNKPAEFKYNKLASTEQNGSNPKEYGASPFIQKHFAHARAVPFVRKRGVAPPNEPFSKRKPKKTQESEQQKEAREVFERKTSEASLPPKDDGVFMERPEEEPEESKYKEEPEESKYKEEPKESKYKEEPEVEEKKSEARALPLPKGILTLDKTNELIKKFMIDDPSTYRLQFGKLTEKGQKVVKKLYESIRFHIMNDEDVKQLPDKMIHYGYTDLENWARETHGNEIRQDDNWLIHYMYGDWNGRWQMLSDDEKEKRMEKKLKDTMEERRKEGARQDEYYRKLAPSSHAKAKK